MLEVARVISKMLEDNYAAQESRRFHQNARILPQQFGAMNEKADSNNSTIAVFTNMVNMLSVSSLELHNFLEQYYYNNKYKLDTLIAWLTSSELT